MKIFGSFFGVFRKIEKLMCTYYIYNIKKGADNLPTPPKNKTKQNAINLPLRIFLFWDKVFL